MAKRRNLASQSEGANKSTTGPTGCCPTFTPLCLLEGRSGEIRTSCSALLERQRRALHEKVTIPFARLSRTAQEEPTAPTAGPRTHPSPRWQAFPLQQQSCCWAWGSVDSFASLNFAVRTHRPCYLDPTKRNDLVHGPVVPPRALGQNMIRNVFHQNLYAGVDVNLVTSDAPSTSVPFNKSMEVEYLHVRLDAETSKLAKMYFDFEKDGERVAYALVLEGLNNTLDAVIFDFNKNGKWGNTEYIMNKDPFSVGTRRRVRLEYSGGLFQGVVWSGDRQKNMTWSVDAPTMGQGNLTVSARIPKESKYSSVVFWPRTCSPVPPSICTPIYIWILAVLVVALVILLMLLSCQLRRTFGLLKDKGENRERDPVARKDEGSEERCNQGPPARHRERRERGASEGRDSINSVYGYIPCEGAIQGGV